MKHRKCDTAKYRRRMAKQNVRHAEKKHERQVQARIAGDRLLVQRLKQEAEKKSLRLRLVRTIQKVAEVKACEKPAPEPLPPRPRPVCPLCERDITLEDGQSKNVNTITFNKIPVQVHKTCPTEVR